MRVDRGSGVAACKNSEAPRRQRTTQKCPNKQQKRYATAHQRRQITKSQCWSRLTQSTNGRAERNDPPGGLLPQHHHQERRHSQTEISGIADTQLPDGLIQRSQQHPNHRCIDANKGTAQHGQLGEVTLQNGKRPPIRRKAGANKASKAASPPRTPWRPASRSNPRKAAKLNIGPGTAWARP